MTKRSWQWRLAAVLAAAATLLAATATPANAEIKYCTGPAYNQTCTISEQIYYSGGVSRSAIYGTFYATDGSADRIQGSVNLIDVITDGWRGSVWVNIYMDCFCIIRDPNQNYLVRSWRFDEGNGSWRNFPFEFSLSSGSSAYYYTVQVIVGRSKSSGACDPANCGAYAAHEQRFYLTID